MKALIRLLIKSQWWNIARLPKSGFVCCSSPGGVTLLLGCSCSYTFPLHLTFLSFSSWGCVKAWKKRVQGSVLNQKSQLLSSGRRPQPAFLSLSAAPALFQLAPWWPSHVTELLIKHLYRKSKNHWPYSFGLDYWPIVPKDLHSTFFTSALYNFTISHVIHSFKHLHSSPFYSKPPPL